jgi:hypothetical protein
MIPPTNLSQVPLKKANLCYSFENDVVERYIHQKPPTSAAPKSRSTTNARYEESLMIGNQSESRYKIMQDDAEDHERHFRLTQSSNIRSNLCLSKNVS